MQPTELKRRVFSHPPKLTPRMQRRYALLLLLAFSLALASAQPTYVSQNFEVYDRAGAGSGYAASVAAALEEAYATLRNRGVELAPPCSGSRYTVNVLKLTRGLGVTRWQYTYERELVKSSCVIWVNITTGLDARTLKKAAYHELVHFAQAAYIRYRTVAESYPWYVEASAEGVAGALSGVCYWEPHYFSYRLHSYNPYSFSGTADQCYALSAFYYWVASSGYATAPQALSNTLSGSSVVSDWVDSAYTSFLLALARGLSLCDTLYTPAYADLHLAGGSSWSVNLNLNGLSAAYYRISFPAPGSVLVSAPSGLKSNILLNEPFKAENTTLLLALVNPSLNPVSGTVTVFYKPPFEVSVVGGVFEPESGRLEVSLRLTYAGQPVEGAVYINGTPVSVLSGSARVELKVAGWGTYTIAAQYLDETAYAKVKLARPSVELETATPLYLSGNGYGELVVRVRNAGDVAVKLRASAVAPPFLQVTPVEAEAPRGESRLSLSFRVVGPVEPASAELQLRFGGDSISLPFSVTPSRLTVVEAVYDSESNATLVAAQANPPGTRLAASVPGFSGEAWFKLSTYYVGGLNVSIPRLAVTLSAKPLLVAPSWLLLAVNASVSTGGACPAYPVLYKVRVAVNGTVLGTAALRCGDSTRLSGVINATHGGRPAILLVERSGLTLEVAVPLPRIEARVVDWLLSDEGSVVEAEVSVSGPCKYVVMGSEVENTTLKLRRELGVGETELVLDTGFGRLVLPMPPVSLKLVVPRVAAAPAPFKLTLILSSQARVNASVELLLDSEVLTTVRFSQEAGSEESFTVKVQPERPALYTVRARAWFASASASVAYVVASGLELEAPRFVLLNRSAEVRVKLLVTPPLVLPVNVTVAGCEHESLQVESNSSLTLLYTKPCTVQVTASFLNLTARAEIRWDALSVAPERSLGLLRGGFVVPNGTLTFAAYFSNGSRAPAEIEVEGQSRFDASKPGRYLLKVRAELMGQVNETVVEVFAVPEGLYRSALAAQAEIGEASHLAAEVESATLSGEWGEVAKFVYAYEQAKSRSRLLLPLSSIALQAAERWAVTGDEESLRRSHELLTYEPLAYLLAALTASAAGLRFRKRKRAKRAVGAEVE